MPEDTSPISFRFSLLPYSRPERAFRIDVKTKGYDTTSYDTTSNDTTSNDITSNDIMSNGIRSYDTTFNGVT
jgi:hypothetical protein